jgi:hypothetical protein
MRRRTAASTAASLRGEWSGSRSAERLPESRENRQVGMNRPSPRSVGLATEACAISFGHETLKCDCGLRWVVAR